jgi:hypothetical protein
MWRKITPPALMDRDKFFRAPSPDMLFSGDIFSFFFFFSFFLRFFDVFDDNALDTEGRLSHLLRKGGNWHSSEESANSRTDKNNH